MNVCIKCYGSGRYAKGQCYSCRGTGKNNPYPQTRYHARQRRREHNAAWAVNAQARLKAHDARGEDNE